jgi:hypothetical protein
MSTRHDSINNDEFSTIEVKHTDLEVHNRIFENYKTIKNKQKSRAMMRVERLLDHLLLATHYVNESGTVSN